MIDLLVQLIILAGIAAIVLWAIKELALPRPVWVVAVCFLAIAGIYILASFGGYAGPLVIRHN